LIFRDHAERHWAAGLPVVPLYGKAVKLSGWSTYCSQMPPEELRRGWLNGGEGTNMGLPLGQQSGVVGIDVDTDDVRVHDMLAKLLPHSPWKRVGKKGCVYAYRFSGERTFRIKDTDGNTILECLSQGAQIVLPPSIHPDINRPYTANMELIDAIKAGLPALPPSIEVVLRGALLDLGYELSTQGFTKITSWVPAGSRDTAMTAFAGLQSRAIVRGEITLFEAMNQMDVWVQSYVEKVAGDSIDPVKAREKVVQFFVRDCTGPKRKPVAIGWDVDLDQKLRDEVRALLGEDGEAWDYQKFMDYSTSSFEDHPVGTGGYMKVIDVLLNKMVSCSSMSAIEEQMFCRFVVNCSNKSLSFATLRKQIDEMRKGEMEGIDHTEIAQALVVELERYGPVRHFNTSWWRYNGACWLKLDDAVILRQVAETFGSYPAARRHSDHKGIVNTASMLVSGPIVTKPIEGINFANGFLTTDLKLVPHSAEYGKSYVLPYRYLPELAGQMPRMHQFLNDCWGGDDDCADKIKALQEAIAVTMFGVAPRFQKAFCLFGISGSGKTVTLDIVKALMPDEGRCSVRPMQWEDNFSPAQMEGKLMNFAGELSGDKMIAGDIFKLIIEGSEIAAQHKYKPIFRMSPQCAHWFGSNHLPRTRDSSAGFTRRWLFLTYTRPVDPKLKNNNLAMEIICEEREAIAAWAAEALPDLMKRQDYTMPKSHIAVITEMATQNNTVRFFMSSAGRVRVTAQSDKTSPPISEATLYDAYYVFCTAVANVRPVSLRSFRPQMQELQGELGFRVELNTNAWGAQEASYASLTLASASAMKSR
jgi:putative DNA primase/helicase